MRSFIRVQCIFWPLLACLVTTQLLAGEPTEQIRDSAEKVIAALTDPDLQGPEKAEERRKRLRRIADERFDWEEMARRALAQHWTERTEEEKRKFVALFSDLLERTYMDRVDNYSGEKVVYEGDSVDGDYGIVNVSILTSTHTEIPVTYRVLKKGDKWLIYDVTVEGVSLVNNYRTQFNSILLKSSFDDLVKRLRAKLQEG